MKILIDTNVLIDYLSGREPYFGLADKIIRLCRSAEITGYMAAHSIPNMFFILRKDYDTDTRRIMIKALLNIVTVSGLDENKILIALDRKDFKDFEDCLQDECAVAVSADYVVTRKAKDYSVSRVKAVTPEEFLAIYEGKTS